MILCKLKHRLFFLLLLLFSIQNFAQSREEYIVTIENDTLYGSVKRKTSFLNPNPVRFKIKMPNGKRVTITPSVIKIIKSSDGIDGDCVLESYNDRYFLKRVIDGRIKVYSSLETTLYYVSKDNSEISISHIGNPFSQQKARIEVRSLIKDRPDLVKEFNATKGRFNDIMQIISAYNGTTN